MNEEKDGLRKDFEIAARKIDGTDVPSPDLAAFRRLADGAMARERKRQRAQLALFAAAAAVIVAALILCMGKSETFFYTLQGAALAGALAAAAHGLLRRLRRSADHA